MLATIEKNWQAINLGVPFEYSFLDEDMANVYADEVRLKNLAFTFTSLAILISLLGIWGLVSYSLGQQTKEIGVHKVLGASVSELTQLLSREFIVLVAISIVIGAPLAYLAMESWLSGFAYKIDSTTFLLNTSAVLTLFVSLVTVIYKTINAANANPIKSIMKE